MTKVFKCRVTKVEEHFERRYKEGIGDARTESQVEYDEISAGWFVSLDAWGIAVRWGSEKPSDIAAGDDLLIIMRKGLPR